MTNPTSDPRPAGDGTRAKASGQDGHAHRIAAQRPALVSRITIDVIAELLGQSYMDGPFGCLRCRRHTTLLTCVIVNDRVAHCGTCGTDFTLARLRRAVTENPQDARTLRRMLEVVA